MSVKPVKVLLSEADIAKRVGELAKHISEDYAGADLAVVGVLTGAVVFVADLIRRLTIPLELDFVAVTSYGNSTKTSGEVRLVKDLGHPINGKHVLIVEDIVDTGLTLQYLVDALAARQPASLECCVLLDKPSRRLVDVDVRYTGFEIDDRFVVGYGLDAAGQYRQLPYIGLAANA